MTAPWEQRIHGSFVSCCEADATRAPHRKGCYAPHPGPVREGAPRRVTLGVGFHAGRTVKIAPGNWHAGPSPVISGSDCAARPSPERPVSYEAPIDSGRDRYGVRRNRGLLPGQKPPQTRLAAGSTRASGGRISGRKPGASLRLVSLTRRSVSSGESLGGSGEGRPEVCNVCGHGCVGGSMRPFKLPAALTGATEGDNHAPGARKRSSHRQKIKQKSHILFYTYYQAVIESTSGRVDARQC